MAFALFFYIAVCAVMLFGFAVFIGGVILVTANVALSKRKNKPVSVFAVVGAIVMMIIGILCAAPGVLWNASAADKSLGISDGIYENTFEYKVSLGDVEQIREMLEKGQNPNQSERSTPLRQAVFSGNYEMVKLLLDYGAEPSDLSLYYACGKGNIDIARLLLEYGADTEQKFQSDYSDYENGNTALWEAASTTLHQDGALPLVKLLLENGANPNAVNDDGETPLWEVVYNDCVYTTSEYKYIDVDIAMAKLLSEYGADLNHVSDDGKTVIDEISEWEGYFKQKKSDLTCWLIDNGAKKSCELTQSNN